jgi:hypothetical protein
LNMAVMAVRSCLEDLKFHSYFFPNKSPNNLSDYANLKESIDTAMSHGTGISRDAAAPHRGE